MPEPAEPSNVLSRQTHADDRPLPAPSASLRILVVDDNADAAESLAILLRLEGHQVSVAGDGPHALEAARVEQPQLAILDLGMPGMDGFEVARRFRAEPALANTLLVALTGWAQDDDRRRCEEAGFDGHVAKPMEWEALRQFLAHPKLLAALTDHRPL
jgi:CheY-like chemotaxis protein